METMVSVWAVMEHVRVASGAAELAIFTALLYWFFTSSRVADMLEVVGERVGGWCGRDTSSSLRQAMRARRRPHLNNDVYAKVDADVATRIASLYRIKEDPVVPAPQPLTRPPAGLACARCAPVSRESWQDPKELNTGAVINILDIGRRNFANGGVVSRYLCDLAQCLNLKKYDFEDVVPSVEKDESFRRAIEETTQDELGKSSGSHDGGGDGTSAAEYASVKAKVEARAKKVLRDISSAMSHRVLRLVAWLCHKAVRRVAGGGCGTRAASAARLRRAAAAGLPLVFVPLHRSHFDYVLVTFTLYLTGLRPPLVAAGDNMRIPFFGWFLRGCGAFYIKRRVEGSEAQCDAIYKAALRSYILNSLGANNNLEFFIEGGRTRTGKPQPPKAGILSVIMDAYLDGTIDDALLVPVTLNYDRLVDGNFVREQLGMPKQMETFWSALRGIWRTLNTNHGGIRVDFNQPISLKELVTSFQKSQQFRSSVEANNNVGPERRILHNHSHSSLYGAGVSDEHKLMVDAIGRHLVYDAAQATAVMCTNVVAYVMLTERRAGAPAGELRAAVGARGGALARAGRDLAYTADDGVLLKHALDTLGRGLVRREGSGERQVVRPQLSIAAALELSYYANTVVAHYAPQAILATALECIVVENGEESVCHEELMSAALRLCEVLQAEFILTAPCTSTEECMLAAIDTLIADDVLATEQMALGLDEEQWSRRFARRLEQDEDEEGAAPPSPRRSYRVRNTPHARAERKRLVLTIRPLLEAYSATCRCITSGSQKVVVKRTLDSLTEDFTQNKMIYGEAVSTDAIKNCLRLLRQWGVIEMYSERRERSLRISPEYEDPTALQQACADIYRFNVNTPLLLQ